MKFDVFLSHNGKDKPAVENLAISWKQRVSKSAPWSALTGRPYKENNASLRQRLERTLLFPKKRKLSALVKAGRARHSAGKNEYEATNCDNSRSGYEFGNIRLRVCAVNCANPDADFNSDADTNIHARTHFNTYTYFHTKTFCYSRHKIPRL